MRYRCVRLFVLFDLRPIMDMFRAKTNSVVFQHSIVAVFQWCFIGVSVVFKSTETQLKHHCNTTETPRSGHCEGAGCWGEHGAASGEQILARVVCSEAGGT